EDLPHKFDDSTQWHEVVAKADKKDHEQGGENEFDIRPAKGFNPNQGCDEKAKKYGYPAHGGCYPLVDLSSAGNIDQIFLHRIFNDYRDRKKPDNKRRDDSGELDGHEGQMSAKIVKRALNSLSLI